ncbi:hypothetical protein J6590_091462 [Homalodisca vitripennis]|nr:hypothetical protein J6590_091462 [Homalodisca vitripennis]
MRYGERRRLVRHGVTYSDVTLLVRVVIRYGEQRRLVRHGVTCSYVTLLVRVVIRYERCKGTLLQKMKNDLQSLRHCHDRNLSFLDLETSIQVLQCEYDDPLSTPRQKKPGEAGNAFAQTGGQPVVWDSYLPWKPLIALNFGLGLILAYAQRARTYLAVRILDLSRVPVQITLFGAEYTLCKAGPAVPVFLALQHPVTDRVHRNHTESLSHFNAYSNKNRMSTSPSKDVASDVIQQTPP